MISFLSNLSFKTPEDLSRERPQLPLPRFKGKALSAPSTVKTDENAPPHFIDEMAHVVSDKTSNLRDIIYQMIVEVPAGTLKRWRVKDNQLVQDQEKGKPRVLNFIPPSFNYGPVPQTLQSKETNGDGEPIDAMVLSQAYPLGKPLPFRLIGGLDIYDEGERATKLIGLTQEGPFKEVNTIEELDLKYPGVLKLLKGWLKNYKGMNKIFIKGNLSKQEAEIRLNECHQAWKDELKKQAS